MMKTMNPFLKPWKEREFWDSRFQLGDTPWDTGLPSQTIVALSLLPEFPKEGTVLIPGCGNGHEALYFSSKRYEVSAVDWSATATNELRLQARRKNLAVEVLQSDFFFIPESWRLTFDVVVEHTFFCAIDPEDRARYVNQILELLKPGGHFIGTFFITQKIDQISVFSDSTEPPFWSTTEEIHQLFSPHFEILRLEVSPHTEKRWEGLQWLAHFKRRS